jgi:hypothetical protein
MRAQVLKSLHAILDYNYKVQFPLHSEGTLALLEQDLEVFIKNRGIFITVQACEANNFNIPKGHYLLHGPENIRNSGTANNYSTETMEALHIYFCKQPYGSTNKKVFQMQIIKLLECQESLRLYRQYVLYTLEWHQLDVDGCDENPDADGAGLGSAQESGNLDADLSSLDLVLSGSIKCSKK